MDSAAGFSPGRPKASANILFLAVVRGKVAAWTEKTAPTLHIASGNFERKQTKLIKEGLRKQITSMQRRRDQRTKKRRKAGLGPSRSR